MLADVTRRQRDEAAGVAVSRAEVPAGEHRFDRPPVAVLHPVGGRDAQPAVVALGDDRIAGARGRAVDEQDLPLVATARSREPVAPCPRVERGDLLAGRGEQQRVAAGADVGLPRAVRRLGGGVLVAGVHPVAV